MERKSNQDGMNKLKSVRTKNMTAYKKYNKGNKRAEDYIKMLEDKYQGACFGWSVSSNPIPWNFDNSLNGLSPLLVGAFASNQYSAGWLISNTPLIVPYSITFSIPVAPAPSSYGLFFVNSGAVAGIGNWNMPIYPAQYNGGGNNTSFPSNCSPNGDPTYRSVIFSITSPSSVIDISSGVSNGWSPGSSTGAAMSPVNSTSIINISHTLTSGPTVSVNGAVQFILSTLFPGTLSALGTSVAVGFFVSGTLSVQFNKIS
jgi:hypothetical protein